ncbi:hypothetical protein ACFVH6_22040 [Spirillospora sp. NPDC127200]
MTDDLRERLRVALDHHPIFGTGDILDAIAPVIDLEIARRAASCGCPEADAEHARTLARAEQDAAALARVRELADLLDQTVPDLPGNEQIRRGIGLIRAALDPPTQEPT